MAIAYLPVEAGQRIYDIRPSVGRHKEGHEAAAASPGHLARARSGTDGGFEYLFDVRIRNSFGRTLFTFPAAPHRFDDAVKITCQDAFLHLQGFALKAMHRF